MNLELALNALNGLIQFLSNCRSNQNFQETVESSVLIAVKFDAEFISVFVFVKYLQNKEYLLFCCKKLQQ